MRLKYEAKTDGNLPLTFGPEVTAHLCYSLYHSFLNMARVPVMSFCKPVHPPPVDINEESLSAVQKAQARFSLKGKCTISQ